MLPNRDMYSVHQKDVYALQHALTTPQELRKEIERSCADVPAATLMAACQSHAHPCLSVTERPSRPPEAVGVSPLRLVQAQPLFADLS